MIHRQTLTELYWILKEEADVFEDCLAKNGQSDYKRSKFTLVINLKTFINVKSRTVKRSGQSDNCSLYRDTLTELFEIVKEEAKNYDECLQREGRKKKSLFLL